MATTNDDDRQEAYKTFSALQTLLLSVDGVDEFLRELAGLAIRISDPPVSCGITVEYDGHPLTVSSSDSWAIGLDETQYQVGEGPCLQSMRTGEPVHVPEMAVEERWPQYVSRAVNQGLHASLSLPLIADGRSVGAVNFYSRRSEQSFDGDVRGRAELFATQASTALLLAVRQMRQSETNQQLERALNSRSVIDQALGILMAQQGCTAERAFDLLRTHSQHNNQPLREVAADLVKRISSP